MSNEQWSEWIEWRGGECPVTAGSECEVRFRCGDEDGDDSPENWDWEHSNLAGDIIAYRYLLDDNTMKQESDMHPDLEWLAKTVSEWQGTRYVTLYKGSVIWTGKPFPGANSFEYFEWLQARKDLGLIMTDAEEELPAQEWAGSITDSEEEAEILHRLAEDESIRTTIGTLRSKYHVVVKGVQIDVYDVLHAFGVTNPADAHAIKKMLKAGQRGYKDANQDRQEAIDSIRRAMELEDEM